MNTNKFQHLAFALLVFLGVFRLQAADAKPNILFIFADDLSYETVGAFGHTDIETPNLDRLVKRGTTFTHTYNMGAWHGAVCVASRTMINTGRFVWRAQAIEPKLNDEAKAGQFWAQLMHTAGYETYFTGKWHVQADVNQIFDHVSHIRPGMPNQTEAGYYRPMPGQPDKWSPYDPQFEGFWMGGKHWSEVLADDADRYLKMAAHSDKPFFMYLAFNAAHDPRQAPKEFVDKYPLARIKVPENFQPEYPNMNDIGAGKDLRDEQLAPWPRTEHAVKVHRQEYYALITHMDVQIGKILDALEATGKTDNTYIFFTADHGLAVGHHGLLGKQNMYEHSLRPPMIVVGPGVPHDKKIDARVYLQDIMPTTLQLAGAPIPPQVEFHSLLPLIEGRSRSLYPAIYGAYMEGMQRAVLVDNFKLIYYPKIDGYQLYDLENDPQEMRDLAQAAAFTPRLMAMKTRLLELEQEMDDPLVRPVK
jgi:arylsulfatase A-like enzyme